jgi:hypothetical protein
MSCRKQAMFSIKMFTYVKEVKTGVLTKVRDNAEYLLVFAVCVTFKEL